MASNRIGVDSARHMRKFCASLNLRRTARVVTRVYDDALKTAGITATQLPLLAAIHAGVNTSLQCLADDLDLERSTVSREIDILERDGLVESVKGTDRRVTQLALTTRGHRTLAKAYEGWQRAHAMITSEYGEDDFEKLLSQTRRLGQTVTALSKRAK